MLTAELNEKLTRVGPGTPGGNMLRRYWYPVAATAELKGRPTKRVRILGEDLVLFRDRSGNLGLIDERCAHRRISLYYGIPEPDGLRCPYHGWLYDPKGNCLEQPAEPVGSTFKDKITMRAYPVQELGGLIFAYLGPEPAPVLPGYDIFVAENAVRQIGATVIPCNWVQIMENSLDQTHVEWLHGYYTSYVLSERARHNGEELRPNRPNRRHVKIGWDLFEHGIIKRRIEEGGSEEDDDWLIGHPVVFPYMLGGTSGGGQESFQIRVPMDDTHTWHIWYSSYRSPILTPPQEEVPFYEEQWMEDGDFIPDSTNPQDIMAWVTQGPIAERQNERLGASDAGIILWRQLLEEQIDRVERGEDPIEVYRDLEKARYVALPRERIKHGGVHEERMFGNGRQRGSQEYRQQVRELYLEAKERGLVPDRSGPAPVFPTTKRIAIDLGG